MLALIWLLVFGYWLFLIFMPPQKQEQTNKPATSPAKKADKDGYYRLGHTTLYYLLFKYGFPAIILFLLELILLGASAGGNTLPPFSEWVSASAAFAQIIHLAAEFLPLFILAAIVFALIMAYGWYLSFRYKLEDNDLSFEKGLLSKQEISVPFHQIENVDIEQSILYRIFGLADLIILTAGHEDPEHAQKDEAEITMPALNAREARHLQRYLLDRSNVQRVVTENASIEPAVPAPLG
jgi:membrane protein YdbS with pleckstrin-like domain